MDCRRADVDKRMVAYEKEPLLVRSTNEADRVGGLHNLQELSNNYLILEAGEDGSAFLADAIEAGRVQAEGFQNSRRYLGSADRD